MNKIIAISIGDIQGIGIRILINSYRRKIIKNFVLVTNKKIFQEFLDRNNISINFNIVNFEKNRLNFNNNKFNIYDFKSKSLEENTYKSLNYAHKLCLKKFCIGIITLPLRKDLIKKKINKQFIGQTEHFQKLSKKNYSNMILYHSKIIITPITTHIKIKSISKLISNKIFLFNQITNLNNTLKIDFNIRKPKLLISGFNPHSGENGQLGNEEKDSIVPVVKKLQRNGIAIDGPLSADTLLIKKNIKKYNCFIFIFHDQALIPFKYISQFSGVNYTGNLNIIRTSPDHGTGYDIINKSNISNESFINCFKLISKIYKNRLINDKS